MAFSGCVLSVLTIKAFVTPQESIWFQDYSFSIHETQENLRPNDPCHQIQHNSGVEYKYPIQKVKQFELFE